MSFVCSGLHRGDRLLPLESSEVLVATDCFRLHVLDGEHDAKLHEHVSFYWHQQRGYQDYQRRLLQVVRSTKAPLRFVGFPQVRQSQVAKRHENTSAVAGALSVNSHVSDTATTAASQSKDAACFSSPSPPTSNRDNGVDVAVEASKWSPPRALAAWNWVRLVAPYERLLCPTLLFSALLSPAVGGSITSLLHGTQPPSASSPVAPLYSTRCVPAKWSSRTCRTLWALHETAAAASLPAQEVYVLCAGTLLYLDVVITSGKVWDELVALWGSDGAPLTCDSTQQEDKSSNTHDCKAVESGSDAQSTALASIKANLSQMPQTYASLLQHVRVLLEAILFVSPNSEGGAPATSSTLPDTGKALPSCPQPLLQWLQTAAEAEEWTAFTNTKEKESLSPSSASSPTEHSARHTSEVAQVLKLAVREWLSRRGTTVTAAAPTGSRAVALPMRDLCASRGSPKLSRCPVSRTPAATPSRLGVLSSADASVTTRDQEKESSSSDGGDAAHRLSSAGPAARLGRGVATGASSSFSTAGPPPAFEAFEPHDMPRSQHPFFLPPLPQDPALLVFTAVWRRTLRRCVLEKDVVRQQLRQVILGQAGQRCEELLAMVRQQQRDAQEGKPCTAHVPPLSTKAAAAVGGADAGIQDIKGSCGKRSSGVHLTAAPLSTSSDSSMPPPPSSSLAAEAATEKRPSSFAPTHEQLLLLTDDPAATSFRVCGPRSGEWLTSRVGAWSGFRGELFRCVGLPPSPLPPAFVSPLGEQQRSPAVHPRLQSSHINKSGAYSCSISSGVLLERFVDGALELDSSTRTSHSSFSSATTARHAITALFTTEELADRLCRLGAAFPRYATEISGDRLRPVDADFTREVLQRQCLPLFLACKRRGIQQWNLRGWSKGLALTLLDNSGTESRLVTPAKLLEMSKQQLVAAMSGTDVTDTAAALRMLMEGGKSEVAAFLEHVQKRKERSLRWLPVKRVAAGRAASSFPLVPLSAVEVLLLRRAEESAIFGIFQCHPQAAALSGCGVQRLALHANSYKSSSLILLVRTCGVVVEWDVQDCYEPPRYRRLRVPKRMMSHEKRRPSSAMMSADDAPPPEIGTELERLTLRHVRGMLQYYRRALVSSSSVEKDVTGNASSAETRSPATMTSAPSLTPAQTASTVGTSGSASQPPGTKRLRENDEGSNGPSQVATTEVAVGCKQEFQAVKEDHSRVKQEGEARKATPDDRGDFTASTSPPSKTIQADAERTSLFPIDRAVTLFVLRHHPQYYTHVVGCGIKEVYVTTSTASAGAAASDDEDCQVHPDDSALLPAKATHSIDTSASSSGPTSDAALKPVIVVERVCGQRVEVDIEACYNQSVDGCPLRPRVTLA
ncbi:hypothetical protein ABL78_1357 [Leptomonas seymouri]|uniref:Uncharacterized protein n=1 Tax=Leptomonas seymouri TaxID=5684 RepID=A0A0N1I0Q2_LEPSE|nr:hypothetical protein ABL78_1357 [Leptomonas seymouri]|eukprot:KPI89481.1 hypothetical protein ABL78_1357 [Leptomonas seymouri]